MRRHNNRHNNQLGTRLALGFLAAALLFGILTAATEPAPQRGVIRREVDLVVLHTTVVNDKGQLITDLAQNAFKVKEDGVVQPLSVFRREAVPVTVGLVLDNSASMARKRDKMMAGSLSFVEVFNKEDEFFVVNFNSDYYLDLEGKDFTSSIEDVRVALDRTATRGQTAIFDAIRASLHHIKGGTLQKKVLLVISDGVDNSSYSSFETLYEEAREAEVGLYFMVLPCTSDDDKRDCRRAKRNLRKLADATGGMAYFPETLNQVQILGRQIAEDVRNQYVLAYNPANRKRDGSYRRVQIEVKQGRKKLIARHRPGYFAKGKDQQISQ